MYVLLSQKLKLNKEKETQIIEIRMFVSSNLLFEFFWKMKKFMLLYSNLFKNKLLKLYNFRFQVNKHNF